MERFTFRTVGGTAALYLGNSSEWAIISGRNNHEYKISGDAVDRLAAYEDTGLEPEEIKVHEAAKYNAGYYHGDEDRCGNKALMLYRAPRSWCYVEELS